MIEFEELVEIERDLTTVAGLIPHKAAQAVQQAAIRTKGEWQGQAKGNTMGQQYTATIDYTAREFGAFGQGVIEAEVGPNLARYGGKTGKGGLTPGFGFFDDPESTPIGVKPVRARKRAELFADKELDKGIEIAVQQSLAEAKFATFGGGIAAVVRGSIG
ncbi:hypothetical protein [Microbacterium paludicola]|uniref:hypothetical protein n=1 Tax=Microbacterium paludicola TaxID=300019 RepID=UPI0011A8BC4E|nr:hypothetical protein [Microbacterium paludicola]